MKALVIAAVLSLTQMAQANVLDSVLGLYKQTVQTQVRLKGKVGTRTRFNLIEVSRFTEGSSLVNLTVVGSKRGGCSLSAEFFQSGDALVYRENSKSGRGTCEVTITNFRDRGILVYENKDKGDCSDLCFGGESLGVRLFDKL